MHLLACFTKFACMSLNPNLAPASAPTMEEMSAMSPPSMKEAPTARAKKRLSLRIR